MKDFIKITPAPGKKGCINVRQIQWFAPRYIFGKAKGTRIALCGGGLFFDGTEIIVKESYEELVAKIEAATAPQ